VRAASGFGEAARRLASLTAEHSVAPQIGMLLRNRPGQVAAFLGVLLGGGTVVKPMTISIWLRASSTGGGGARICGSIHPQRRKAGQRGRNR
jgi:hypothetical protein